MHHALQARGVPIALCSVTYVMHRDEALVAFRVADQERIKTRRQKQDHVILTLDGWHPAVGQEVLRAVRDSLSEDILRARPLLRGMQVREPWTGPVRRSKQGRKEIGRSKV
jgi:hypothetical protein